MPTNTTWTSAPKLKDYSYGDCTGTPPQVIYVTTVGRANEVVPLLEGYVPSLFDVQNELIDVY
jgi:hypothetical protein